MLRFASAAVLASVVVTPLAAQGAPPMSDNASVAAVRTFWEMITNYVTQSAQDMPEEKYDYRPTPEVRSFGELVGHVAGAQNLICGVAMGEQPRAEDEIEKTVKGKANLIEALKASTAVCARAYEQADAATRAPVELFGQQMTRFHALTLNAVHNGEHYGNIVTYLRINGIVPPSSRGGM